MAVIDLEAIEADLEAAFVVTEVALKVIIAAAIEAASNPANSQDMVGLEVIDFHATEVSAITVLDITAFADIKHQI